ncbi:MAG: peptidylprolyl isomerase [Ignavibacteria bacterium]|nr:peptidylprolyl isomerase [Ignavibacteria bacterium]MBL7993057.1 peptidylprolyl isomerase [Candidatus Kapabacteria bacterium]
MNSRFVAFLFTAIVLVSPILTANKASAQGMGNIKSGEPMDKIVAIVGNEIILQSEVVGHLMMSAMQERRTNARPDDPVLLRRSLDVLINEKLIVTKAIEDSLTASEDEITERMDYQIQAMMQQMGSERRIEEVYGMSMAKIRRDFRDEIRKQLLTERLSQQKFAAMKVSSKEVQDFFKQYKDSIPPVPPQFEIYHIVKNVEPSPEAKDKTLALAKKIRDSLVAGGDFATFARRYSNDPGSAASGGDLGFVERGKFIAEFEKTAYALQIGEISQPVETPFGFHVIQLLDKRETAVKTRHILLKLGQTDDDATRTKKFLDSLRMRVAKGESFEDLAKQYSDDTDTKAFGGLLGRMETTKLPADLREKIEKLKDGEITEALTYSAPGSTKSGFNIVFRKKYIPEHKITFDDDYKRLEQMTTMQKRAKVYDDWMKELRKSIYWEVKGKL